MHNIGFDGGIEVDLDEIRHDRGRSTADDR
jgi:hypothetical protein